MTSRRRLLILPVGIVAAIAIVVMVVSQPGGANEYSEPIPTMPPASAADAAAFEGLLHRYNRIQFDARVTGDSSLYPTVLYHDPDEEFYPEYDDLMHEHQYVVDAALANATGGPVGATTGFLSAQIAVHASNMMQANLWATVSATAAAEGRYPSISDLPDGVAPIEPVTPDQWVYQTITMHTPMSLGDRGEAKFTFGTSALDGTIMRLTYIRVGGDWYISAIHWEGTP
jgi:hypothetical protein